jgi:hypothetical protein
MKCQVSRFGIKGQALSHLSADFPFGNLPERLHCLVCHVFVKGADTDGKRDQRRDYLQDDDLIPHGAPVQHQLGHHADCMGKQDFFK